MTVHSRSPGSAAAEPRFTTPAGVGVDVRLLGFGFGGADVLGPIKLAVAAGTWLALLGPSGAGKTTLLRLMAGLIPCPVGCSVAADDGGPLAGRAAYMAQQDLLLPWLTVRENVTLGARIRGETADLARAAALLGEVGLAQRANQRPAALSGGERQRVALARTLMEDKPVVLMDEPFSALDAISRLKLQDLAAKLLAGRTVLHITHDPVEALRLGHRVAVLAGTPAILTEGPALTGSAPHAPTDPRLAEHHGALLRMLEGGEP